MSAQAEFRAALSRGDVDTVQRVHAVIFPHVPAPATRDAAEAAMHMARTQAGWLHEQKRCYSHAWLTERALPSQLPDDLKPKADRLYPRIAEGVLVSCNTMNPHLKPVTDEAQRAMSDTVEDCYANGDTDPGFVRSRILDARATTFKKVLGTTRLGDVTHG